MQRKAGGRRRVPRRPHPAPRGPGHAPRGDASGERQRDAPRGGASGERTRGARELEGRIQHRGEFAFLISEEPGARDVFVDGPSLRLALDGDRVAVRVTGQRRGRPVGEIARIVRRARERLVGKLSRRGGSWSVLPEEGAFGIPVLAAGFGGGVEPREGALAVVRVTRWPAGAHGAEGVVEELLGMPGTLGVRVSAILRAREIVEEFPAGALRETAPLPDSVPRERWSGRRLLFELPHFTIDGADAKDFDDAVSLETLPGGRWRLGVHIADVSAYVRPGTELDAEAARRATSVYLPDRVVPMLPPKLSDKLCSLMPGVERLALSCFLDLDDEGKTLGARFEETVLRSWRRFTYEEVETLLRGGRVEGVDSRVRDAVLAMGRLAECLTRRRLARGALDFDMPEFKVRVAGDGRPEAIERRERLASHRLIEEFMILANEAAARHLIGRGRAFPSRVHERPDPRKLAELAAELRGLQVPAPAELGPRALQGLLRKAADHPLRDVIGLLVMRSMRQAVYRVEPGPHFGLASEAYCHFTSPIRRYPDLLVHRALRAELGGRAGAGKDEVAAHCGRCSERERAAAEAERDAVEVFRAEYLRAHAGSVFRGVVTRAVHYGAFIELEDTGAVGLARGARAKLGERVSARVESVDAEKGEIELSLAGAPRGDARGEPPRVAGGEEGRSRAGTSSPRPPQPPRGKRRGPRAFAGRRRGGRGRGRRGRRG